MIRVHNIPPEPSQNFVKKKGFGKAGCPYDNSPMIFFSVNVTKMLDHLRHRDCSVRKNEVDGLS